ncbi:alpha/beta fold hydrolase [Ramlibacter sp. AN1133]|uniref:alpha/beta fold hydrolase n=1 Tax=Ramlibacter sp. AN1133 TaxID=3133429 RepID=UPI0030C3C81D
MNTGRVGDIDMAYELEGPAGAPVVMLAHGILTTHGMWRGVAQALLPRWRVLGYDLRGHGGTRASEPPYTMQRLAQDAIALLDALDLQRVHFIGSSLGGMIGQRVAALHGKRFLSVTLANTAAVQGAPQAWQERIATAREKGVAALVEPTLQRWFSPAFLAANPEPVQRMRALAAQTDVRGFCGCAAAVRDLAHAEILASIRPPTLVIVGEQDQATPPAAGEFIQQRIRGSRLARLPAGHQSAVECPEAFAAAWEAFARTLS